MKARDVGLALVLSGVVSPDFVSHEWLMNA